jgi:uncharacterized protein
VRDDHHHIVPVAKRDFVQTTQRTLTKRMRTLAAGHYVVGITALKALIIVRKFLFDLGANQTFEYAEVALAQTRLDPQFTTGRRRDTACRIARAQGIAAVQRAEFDVSHSLRKQSCLAHTGVRQRGIGMPLHTALAIPQRLTVADQNELSHLVGDGQWVMSNGFLRITHRPSLITVSEHYRPLLFGILTRRMTPDPATLIIVIGIAFVAYTLFALSGFGANLVTVPLLGHFYPLTFAMPMLALLDAGAAMRVGFQSRGHLLRRELAFMLPWLLAGMVAGTTLLVKLPSALTLGTLGTFIMAYGIYSLGGRTNNRLPQWSVAPASFAGGVLSALFGTGGAVYVTYLSARGHDVHQVRSTITVLLIITALARIALFALYGLYAQENVLLFALAVAPAMLAGVYLGHRLHLNLSKRTLTRCIAIMLIASGASLLIKIIVGA